MSITKVCRDILIEVGANDIVMYTPKGTLYMNVPDSLALADAIIRLLRVTEPSPQEQPVEGEVETVVETVVEATPKKRGRPRKAVNDQITDAVTQTLAEMPRGVEPDAVVHLDGGDVKAEVIEWVDGEVVAAYSEADGSGGVLVVPEAQVEQKVEPKPDPFNPELQETLVKRFPIGMRVRTFNVNEQGDHVDGVLTKHFEGAHKCQISLADRVVVVDTREIADATQHSADPEVIEKMKGGTYGVDYGQRWLGVPLMLLDDLVQAAFDLGMDAKEARLTLAALVRHDGFVSTQAAATSVALYFASQEKDTSGDPLTTDELATVRAEVKAAGVSPSQAKDLCYRHFGKDSAALLTRGEMQKFLGEILPTWVEMQGAEDF